MKSILVIVALACLVENISAADLDGIQNATPIGIPLNNPSIEVGGENNGDAALEEHNLSGYRPLYPPYFRRNGNEQRDTYYDKEYYSRGAQIGNFDARLDRTLKNPSVVAPSGSPTAADDVQVYVVSLDSKSQPQSVVQLQNQPQTQLQVPSQPQAAFPSPPRNQFQFQPQIQSQPTQQFARGFSSYHNQQTQSFFYSFKFPSS